MCNIFLKNQPLCISMVWAQRKAINCKTTFMKEKKRPGGTFLKWPFLEVLNQRTVNNFLLFWSCLNLARPYHILKRPFLFAQEFFHIRHLLQLEPFPPCRILNLWPLLQKKAQRSLTKCIISHAEPKK